MRILASSRCKGFFTIDAAVALLLALAVFFIASQHLAFSSRFSAHRSSHSISSATVSHISDYLVKGGAAEPCPGASSLSIFGRCVSHHHLSESALAIENSKFSQTPKNYGFSGLQFFSGSAMQFNSENQFCSHRDYYLTTGEAKRVLVCGW